MTPFTLLLLSLALTTIPLGVGLLLARRLRGRAALCSLLLRATLVATIVVLATPLLPLSRPRPSWLPSLFVAAPPNAPRPARIAVAHTPVNPNLTEPKIPAAPSKYFDGAALPKTEAETATPSIEAAPEIAAPIIAVSNAPSKYFEADWRTCLAFLWAAGALMMLMVLACCHLRLAFLRHGGTSMDDGDSFDQVRDIASAWSMPVPRLWSSARIDSPFACGVWRASICLPDWWPQDIDATQQRTILRHEMAHVRRADCAWNALALTMRAVLWPQPLLWLLCRGLVRNSEDVCDEAALEGEAAPQHYARCLLDLSQRLHKRGSFERTIRTAGAGARPTQSELGRRVRRILSNLPRDAWRLPLRARLGAGAGIAIVAIAALLMTGEAAQSENTSSKKPTPKVSNSLRRTGKVLSGTITPLPKHSLSGQKDESLDLSSPRMAVESFVRALNDGNDNALVRCVRTSNKLTDIRDFAQWAENYGTFNLDSLRVQQKGNDAIVRAQANVVFHRAERRVSSGTTVLRLKRFGRDWQLIVGSSPLRRDDPFAWTVNSISNPNVARLNRWALSHGNAILEGKVLLPDGKPAAKVYVRLAIDLSARNRIPGLAGNNGVLFTAGPVTQRVEDMLNRQVLTGADGRYRIEGLTTARYSIAAHQGHKDGVNTARQIAPSQYAPTRENTVSRAPDLVLKPTAQIEVLVIDNTTEVPLHGVFLIANAARTVSKGIGDQGFKTLADGRATFRLLPGRVTLNLAGQMSRRDRSFITYTRQGIYNLTKGARIQVESGASIPFHPNSPIQCLPNQLRRVTIRLAKYRYVAPPKPKQLPPPRLTVPRGGEGSGVLSGKVLYEDGRPAAGVRVGARMQRSAQWDVFRSVGLDYGQFNREPYRSRWNRVQKLLFAGDTTDAEGNFRLTGLMTAPYDLMTGDSSYSWPNPGTINGTLSSAVIGAWARDGQTIRRAAPIVLTRGALIRGRVVDRKSGAGVGGVIIACYGPHRPRSSDSVASVRTDADGSFQMRVAPGRKRLYIAGPPNNRMSGHTRFADDAAENANRSVRQGVYVINAAHGLYDGSRSRYRLDQDAAWHETKDMEQIEVEAQKHQTYDLEIQLRRLRPATPAEEEM